MQRCDPQMVFDVRIGSPFQQELSQCRIASVSSDHQSSEAASSPCQVRVYSTIQNSLNAIEIPRLGRRS